MLKFILRKTFALMQLNLELRIQTVFSQHYIVPCNSTYKCVEIFQINDLLVRPLKTSIFILLVTLMSHLQLQNSTLVGPRLVILIW